METEKSSGTDLRDTMELILGRMATNPLPKPQAERNSEGYGYLLICVLASAMLYFGLISEDNWMILAGGAAAFYGAGRVILKKGGENT